MKGLKDAIRFDALAGSVGKGARIICGSVRETATDHRIKGGQMIVAFGLFSIPAPAQTASFTGRVTDETGGVSSRTQSVVVNGYRAALDGTGRKIGILI